MTPEPQPITPSPHKLADPLGWPFGALPPQQLARLRRQRDRLTPPPPAPEPAPF